MAADGNSQSQASEAKPESWQPNHSPGALENVLERLPTP